MEAADLEASAVVAEVSEASAVAEVQEVVSEALAVENWEAEEPAGAGSLFSYRIKYNI
jgi:hypothetical protein